MRPAVVLLALIAVAFPGPERGTREPATCAPPAGEPGYAARVETALRAGRDVWGESLLASNDGPTYAGASRFLRPILFARAARQTRLTRSRMHYVAFSHPSGVRGAESVALHVADGGAILAQRADGAALTISVGGERYGGCLGRLTLPRLAGGYLPILQTAYVDGKGVRYRQESFAARVPDDGPLVSFVRLTADARASATGASMRFAGPSASLSLAVRRGARRTVAVAWPLGTSVPERIGLSTYVSTRSRIAAYWTRRLAEGARFQVPERRVMNAQRALLIQNLGLTWRYSIGNAYEQFSFPEGVDAAQVLGYYGLPDVARAMLRTSLTRRATPYPNWKIGQKLVGSALQHRLFADRAYLDAVTPTLEGYLNGLERQLDAEGRGLLQRERFSSDISDSVYGLHSQAVVWQGLRWLGQAWAETGRATLAERCRTLADRLERGLRAAVRASQVRLPDGSLFLPARLLDAERPYERLTASRPGSYWNLVVPYALASGLFAPGSIEAQGAFRYLALHGSRLLGLVRAGAYALYGLDAPYPTSGTDQVYGLNVARFFAANDRPDHLVLALYGQLAAAMTPDTFVAGEAASVTPLPGEHYRSMYLPPNGAANATFLGTLRLMLVHETVDGEGRPTALQLAHATPRAWLAAGKQIAVRNAPTSFGRLSYSVVASAGKIRATISVPSRAPLRALSLRLRLPRGDRVMSARLGGRALEVIRETVLLPRGAGRLELVVDVERGRSGS